MKLIKLLSVMLIPLIPSVAYAAEISTSWRNITMSQRKGIVVREATNLTPTNNGCNVAFVCADTNTITEVAALPPIAGRVSGNPALIQSRFGSKGNFEVVVPLASGGLALYFRDNDNPNFPWSGPFPFGQSVGRVDAVSLIQSNFGSPGNLEVVARVGNRLAFFFRDSGPAFTWNGPFFFASGVSGNPALIQSRFGSKGNFEVVVPLASGGLALYFRDNDNPNFPWSGPFPFGQSVGRVDAVSLIQSNFGSPGNLEVVARVGNRLAFFFRDSGPAFTWNGPFFFASGVSGNPALIQSRFGSKGNFEVVVPLASGGLALYFRDNDNPNFPWSGPFPFGQSVGRVDAVSLIQSNFGSPGNLEVVARVGNRLAFFFRDSGPAFTWNGPFFFTSGF